jgi:hypothetical protein
MDASRHNKFFPARYFFGVILKPAFWLFLVVVMAATAKWISLQTLSFAEPQSGVAEIHYRNCAAARAAGAAPIHIGEPGYEPRLDADNDGIACEPWRR